MSAPEKRYFKVYASKLRQQKQKKYLLLFDKISKQSAYDESALVNAFSGYKFTKQFGVAKNYLFQLILRSLREYHSTRRSTFQIHNSLQEAKILELKGLIKSAYKLYQKAAELAEQENKPMLALEGLLRLEQLSREYSMVSVDSLDSLFSKKEKMILQVQKVDHYKKIHRFLIEFLKNPNGKKAPSKEDLSISLTEENIELESESHFIFALSARLELLSTVFHGNNNQIPDTCDKILNSLDLASINKITPTQETLKLIEQVGTSLLHAGADSFFHKEFANILSSLSEHYSEKAAPQLHVIEQHIHLRYSILKAKWQQSSSTVKRLSELIYTYEKSWLTTKQWDEIAYDIAYTHFINGDYNEALAWLVSFTTRDVKDEMDDTTIYGHILALISHFESSHFEVLSYLNRQTIAIMQKSRKLYEYELFFLNYMRTIKRFDKYENRYSFYSTLHNRLTHAQESRIKSSKEEMLFCRLDFTAWVESKLKEKKLSNILANTSLREYSVPIIAPSEN